MRKIKIIMALLADNIWKKMHIVDFFKKRNEIKNWFMVYLLYSSFILVVYELFVSKILKKPSKFSFPTKYTNGYICYRPITDYTTKHTIDLYIHTAYEDYMGDFYKFNQYNIDFEDDDIIVDIGAHIGTFSVQLATKNPNVEIFIYEADPNNYNLINKSIQHIDAITRIHTFNNAAYCKSNEVLNFSKGLTSTTGSIEEVGFFKKSSKAYIYEVKTISLSDIFKNNNIKKCKILKIDCEGCEYGLFNDEAFEILKYVQYLFIELHKTTNNHPRELMQKLEKEGFEFKGNFAREHAWELYGINTKIKA